VIVNLPKPDMLISRMIPALLWLLLATGATVTRTAQVQAATQPPEPYVAVHVSELTRNLETMPAVPPTPTGTGTTGYQWWNPSWRYFVAHESLKEALRSDGTPFVTVSDADIAAGKLLNPDGSPRYPILFSLASEAVADNEISPLRDYVTAGGFLFVGSSAFTRNPNGTTRDDFALATEMGVHMTGSGLANWYPNAHFMKNGDHRLTGHIPADPLVWNAPLTADQVPWGVSPGHVLHGAHSAWQVVSGSATVLADGDSGPLLTVKTHGQGQFIYHAAFQPLIGHGGYDPGMYAYLVFRRAIEWAFESAGIPIVKVSPWPYQYDAAFINRHDLENNQTSIRGIESSARFEHSLGVKGDYYFSTGALRDDMAGNAAVVSSLKSAVSNYGATIGSHNGGLKNPVNPSLAQADYDYWHWGPDEALDVTPPGYTSGKAYAKASILKSFQDIEGWLSGMDNGRAGCGAAGNCPRTWVSPYFNSTREDSRDIVDQLGAVTMGEQKISPFPHRTLSYSTPGKYFSAITLPVSDWFVNGTLVQAINDPFGYFNHTTTSVRDAVDFYYDLGALINIYTHAPSDDGGAGEQYVTYGMSKPLLWSTNSVGVNDWWRLRSSVAVTPTIGTSGSTFALTAAVAGATDPATAIEFILPRAYQGKVTVFLDGTQAGSSEYRTTSYGVKVRAGASVSRVRVQNEPNHPPVAVTDAFGTKSGTPLNQAAPGVLGNDTDFEGATLTAKLVSAPAHGALSLTPDGSFVYTPAANYTGSDSFTYTANDGTADGSAATVTVTVQTQPPAAVNDAYSTYANSPLSLPSPGVLVNDSDPQGLSLTARLSSAPAHGALTLNSDGLFIYTPAADWAGSDSFTYVANNGTLDSNTATVTISVLPTLVSLALDPASITGGNTARGTVTLSGPAPSGGTVVSLGADSAAVTVPNAVTVPAGGTSATFAITTTPVAASAAVTISAVCGGETKTAALLLALFADDFTRVPDAPDPLSPWTHALGTWTVTDGMLQGSSSPFTYAAIHASTTPLWTDYSVEGEVRFPAEAFGGGIGGRVDPASGARYGAWVYPEGSLGGSGSMKLVKFRDWTTWNGTPMQQVSLPGVGTGWHTLRLAFNGNRIRVYYDGTLMIDVTDNDFDSRPPYLSGGISGEMWTYTSSYAMGLDNVVVTSSTVISPPVTGSDSYVTSANSPLTLPSPGVLGNDADPRGLPLTARLSSGPAHGTLALNADGSFVYTPTANYVGSDSFTYAANNGIIDGNVATVSITVQNRAPVATNDTYGTSVNFPLNQPPPGVLANDTDFEGGNLTAKLVSGPAHGTLTLNANGSFVYTPTANWTGNDSFTYTANDGIADGNAATVTVTVQKQPPAAGDDAYVTYAYSSLNQAAPGVLVNDSDPQGLSLTARLSSAPAHGTLTLGADGSFVYTPTANWAGSDSFTYVANNGALDSNTATVAINVMPTLVLLAIDPASVTGGGTARGTVTLSGPAPGTGVAVSLSTNSSTVTVPSSVTVPAGSTGATFSITTTSMASSTAVTVSAVYGGVTRTAVLTIVLLADDFTRDSGATEPLSPWTVALGTWSAADGVLQGSGSPFTYAAIQASTPQQWTDYAVEARIQLPAGAFGGGIGGRVNPASGARYGAWVYPEGSAGGSNMLKLVKFRDWTTWNGTPMQQVSIPGVGTAWHTLRMAFNGSQIRVYYDGALMITVTDGNFDSRLPYPSGGISGEMWTDTTSYGMGIDNVIVSNETVIFPPGAVNDAYSTMSDTPLNQAAPGVLGNDSDPQGLPLTAQLVSGPAHGTLALNANGSFGYTPTANYTGSDSFSYTVSNGTSTGNAATVSLEVLPKLVSVALNPASVTGGSTSLGTVTLNGPAPGGGAAIALNDNSSAVTVPASVTVPGGSTSTTFTIATASVTTATSATVSAVYGGVTKTASLTVTPPVLSTISGTITPVPPGEGATVTLNQGATTITSVTAAADGTYAFPSVANGTYNVTPSKAGFTFTPASATVTVNGANVNGVNFTAAGLSVDVTTFADAGPLAGNTVTTPIFTTRAANELLLAFIPASYANSTPHISVTGVSGGGLTWTLVKRTNSQQGTAEIWKAFATAPLTNATVTATLSKSGAAASITVVAFAGVNTTTPVGAVGGGSAATGAPAASLTTQGSNSWVFGVANDWDGAIARTVGSNQTMIHQYLSPTADTFWVQRQNATIQAAGTVVTINDTAPANHQWNMSIVEVRQ
jgi:VCBS repeat-containing protein